MTLKGGMGGACAACKFQRRRCAADCQLAPYFPAEQPKLFQNVHKLFGVKSIVKTLKTLDESQKPEAMKSIIFQSYVRDRFPVHGCLGVTQQLQYTIWLAEEELRIVNAQLQLHRQQNNNVHSNNISHHQMVPPAQEISDTNDVTSQLDLGMAPPVKSNYSNAMPSFSSFHVSQPQTQMQPQQQVSYSYSCGDVNGYSSTNYTDSRETLGNNNSAFWGKQYLYAGFNPNNSNENKNHGSNGVMATQSQQLLNPQLVAIHQESPQDCDEIHPFFDIIDDRQSYVDTKEAYESSSEESLKDTTQLIEHDGENELKSAATCFSLTSVN